MLKSWKNTALVYLTFTDMTYFIDYLMHYSVAEYSTSSSWGEKKFLSPPCSYNNQWMIVDYNKFNVGKNITNGTLWVVEQLPWVHDSV